MWDYMVCFSLLGTRCPTTRGSTLSNAGKHEPGCSGSSTVAALQWQLVPPPSQHRPCVSQQHHMGHCSASTRTRKRLKEPSNQMEGCFKRSCCRIVSKMMLLSEPRWLMCCQRCRECSNNVRSVTPLLQLT